VPSSTHRNAPASFMGDTTAKLSPHPVLSLELGFLN